MLTSRDALLTGQDEFQRLALEHSQYSQRLESLTQKRYLTEDEKLEEVRLKKLKLRLKDQMLFLETPSSGTLGQTIKSGRKATSCGSSGNFMRCHEAHLSAFFYCSYVESFDAAL